MIRINQIKWPKPAQKIELKQAVAKLLKCPPDAFYYDIVRLSIDARSRHPLAFVYSVDVTFQDEKRETSFLKKNKNKNITKSNTVFYEPLAKNLPEKKTRPIVVGSGPAGLFCAYLLALNGYRPILLERGKCVEERQKDVDAYWNGTEALNVDSNVQFGEGGAGTFSDGKLNTVVKDRYGRQRFILKTFVECGAPEDICYLAKPHIGTDYLKRVVANLRKELIRLGAEVHFETKVSELLLKEGAISGVKTQTGQTFFSDRVVLALGHSARDTFQMLQEQSVNMESKPFAVGVRIEHPREQIDRLQYKEHYGTMPLPTASYKLTHQCSNGRSAFTFCMCPGGYVVNASSEEGAIVVNGMSDYARDAHNSNTAVIVSVTKEDYGSDDALAGVAFQRKLEQAAFQEGKGKIPVQLWKDFVAHEPSKEFGAVVPCEKGAVTLADVTKCLPDFVTSAIIETIGVWGKKMPGFDREDALVLGVESRTSSPVKILRNERMQSNIKGIYPCGEGAGYAGGIMSAAIDGLKVAEAIIKEDEKNEG